MGFVTGCGCTYTPFGCCPDNTTTARGPNNTGCGCQYTEHKCCPDNFTPASGPQYEGCSCQTYQFGCCSDGITRAVGPNSQGTFDGGYFVPAEISKRIVCPFKVAVANTLSTAVVAIRKHRLRTQLKIVAARRPDTDVVWTVSASLKAKTSKDACPNLCYQEVPTKIIYIRIYVLPI